MVKNVTIAVSDELKNEMETLSDINWSEVGRKAFDQKVKDMKFFEKIKAKSKLTEEDALKLGRQINRAVAKRFLSK